MSSILNLSNVRKRALEIGAERAWKPTRDERDKCDTDQNASRETGLPSATNPRRRLNARAIPMSRSSPLPGSGVVAPAVGRSRLS